MSSHTPTPLKYDGVGLGSLAVQDCGTDGYTVIDEECNPICDMIDIGGDQEAEAHAALIVKAVNEYDRLIGESGRLKADSSALEETRKYHCDRCARFQAERDACAELAGYMTTQRDELLAMIEEGLKVLTLEDHIAWVNKTRTAIRPNHRVAS